ncbi:phytase [Clostridium niameyense]|uniref:Phytase n=1 Tax=Clostridium niameyense TaxID=1622073 RepID=A0A6M0RCW3_9CLOT|nr:dual specificity protein phosphatase family protein [Clostridium niameyense]NEZ47647.1 phytase [Clostridium niameyense]
MNIKVRRYVSSILILFLAICSIFILKNKTVNAQDKYVNLVLDSLRYDELPDNFRSSSNLTNIKGNKSLNINGLESLNISGSEQFSKYNLSIIKKNINTSLPITVIDLRQESHGFINGFPVSWQNKKNNANMGLTKEQVLLDEANKLNNIRLNTPFTFYNCPDKTIIPKEVQNEEKLVKSNSLSYVRIPVTDGKIPTDDMVDYFVNLINNQSEKQWLHFHCKRGIGRTSTFMIMYDMMKNYNKATADEIIKRQLALSNLKEDDIKSFYRSKKRMTFLQQFYIYCKESGNNFNIKWSEWKKTHSNVSFYLN